MSVPFLSLCLSDCHFVVFDAFSEVFNTFLHQYKHQIINTLVSHLFLEFMVNKPFVFLRNHTSFLSLKSRHMLWYWIKLPKCNERNWKWALILLVKTVVWNHPCYFWGIWLKETYISHIETLKTGQIWPEDNRRIDWFCCVIKSSSCVWWILSSSRCRASSALWGSCSYIS